MTGLIKLLVRALVRTFYEANVGFFLVVFYLAFGLMRTTEHIAIASSIANSWPLTLLTLALWVVYGLKAQAFLFKILQTKPYRIIRDLALYPANLQRTGLTVVHFLVLAPAWAYGIFISYWAFVYGSYLRLDTFLLFLVVLTLASAEVSQFVLRQPVRESKPGLWYRLIAKRWALPRFLWYVRHAFVHDPLPTLLAKLGALLVLVGTFYLYGTDTYDWRLLAVGSLFAYAFNTMLVYGSFAFRLQNAWTFALPLSQPKVVLTTFLTWVVLFVPEMLVIGYHAIGSTSAYLVVNLCLFIVAMAFFWLGMLTRFPISREDYGKSSFYLVLVLVLVMLYGVPLLSTNVALLGLGVWGLYGVYKLKWGV